MKLWDKVKNSIFFYTLIIFALFHVILFTYYLNEHSSQHHEVQKGLAIQTINELVRKIEMELPELTSLIVTDWKNEKRQAFISDQPYYTSLNYPVSPEQLNKLLSDEIEEIHLSLPLKNSSRWLNIHIQLEASLGQTQWNLFLLEAIALLAIIFYVWSVRRFEQPLKEFQKMAQQLGVDIHMTVAHPVNHAPRVVRETAKAMQKMQERIQQLLQDRLQLLAAISHDLRTPLTRIKLRSHLINDPKIQQKNDVDINDMENMIQEILMFAKGDYKSEPISRIDLFSLLSTLCDEMEDLGAEVELQSHHSGQLPFDARPLMLKRAINNLLYNAVKYGERAKLTLQKTNSTIQICILDEGPGIPEEALEKVFTPFYRCEQSRSRHTAGTGLGLTIARDIILAHNGSIELHNRTEGGLAVIVTFYLS